MYCHLTCFFILCILKKNEQFITINLYKNVFLEVSWAYAKHCCPYFSPAESCMICKCIALSSKKCYLLAIKMKDNDVQVKPSLSVFV
jgi:hypothetical protein